MECLKLSLVDLWDALKDYREEFGIYYLLTFKLDIFRICYITK